MNNLQLAKLKQEELYILKYIDSFCAKNKLDYFLIGGTLLGAIRHNGFIPWDDDIDIAMPRKDFQKLLKNFKDTSEFEIDSYYSNKQYWLPFIKIRKKGTKYIEDIQAKYTGSNGIWIDIFPLDDGMPNEYKRFKKAAFLRKLISYKSGIRNKKTATYKKIILTIICPLLSKKWLIKKQFKIMSTGSGDYYLNIGSQYGCKRQTHLKEKFYPIKKAKFEDSYFNIPNDPDYVLTNIYGKNYMQLPPIEKRTTHNPIYAKFSDGEEFMVDKK